MKLLTYFTLCLCLLLSCGKIDLSTEITDSAELIKQEKYKEAEEKLERLKTAYKKTPRLIVLVALTKAGLDKKQEVLNLVKDATDLIEEKPEEAESFTQLGVACYMVGYFDEAIKLLNISNGLRPDDIYTITMLIKAEYDLLAPKSSRGYAIRNQYKKLADPHEELNKTLEYYNLSSVIEILKPDLWHVNSLKIKENGLSFIITDEKSLKWENNP